MEKQSIPNGASILQLLIVFAVLGILIIPNAKPIVGLAFRWEYDSLMTDLERHGLVPLETEHKLGWQSSTIETLYTPIEDHDVSVFRFVTTVEHGPARDDNGVWYWAKAKTHVELGGGKLYPEADSQIRTYVPFGQDAQIVFDFPSHQAYFPLLDLSIDFRGFDAFLRKNPVEVQDPFLTYQFGGLVVETDALIIDIGTMDGTVEFKASPAGNLLSDDVARMTHFRITTVDGVPLALFDGLHSVTESDATGGLLAGSSRLTIETGRLGTTTFGPIALDLGLGNWSDSAMAHFQRESVRIREVDPNTRGGQKALRDFFVNTAWQTILGNPYVDIGPLHIERDGEVLTAGIHFAAKDLAENDFKDEAWLPKLTFRAYFKSPEPLFRSLVAGVHDIDLIVEGTRDGWYTPNNLPEINKEVANRAQKSVDDWIGRATVAFTGDHAIAGEILFENGRLLINGRSAEDFTTQFMPLLKSYF